jgi:virginiamycin B lyase
MNLSSLKTLIYACLLVPNAAWAEEKLSDEKLVIEAEIQRNGDFMGFGFGSLWLMSGSNLIRVDPSNNSVTEIDIDGSSKHRMFAIGEGAVWVPDVGKGMIFKVDPNKGAVVKEIPAQMLSTEGSIGVGEGSVWVVTAEALEKALTRFNADTGVAEAKISLPSSSTGVLVDFGSVWVTGTGNGELYRIDPKTNAIGSTIKLHDTPRLMTSGEGSVWVLNEGDGSVQRIDGKTGNLISTIETTSGFVGACCDITFGGGYVWLTNLGDAPFPLAQIDPKNNRFIREFTGHHVIGGNITFGAGSLWVSGAHIYRIQPPN